MQRLIRGLEAGKCLLGGAWDSILTQTPMGFCREMMPSLSGKAEQAPVQHTVTAAPYPWLWDVVQVGAHPAELCQLQMESEASCWGLRSMAGGAGELMLESPGPAVAAGSP